MTTLNRKAAFLHVIDDHRWLAASGCAWGLVAADAVNGTKAEAHRLLPNIDVMIRDCLLLHARSLIKFYRNNGWQNDILLKDFGVSINPSLGDKLEWYEKPIEVHLLHLTDWRDCEYRDLDSTDAGAERFRPDWNLHTIPIVDLIFEALNYVSKQSGSWQQPFRDLYDASTARYRDKLSAWPANLCEKSDVKQYLTGLEL